ncbi:MAG: hypothetical protein KDE19_24600, partial [Caldilineaceae bacterium]|nr:hypothetical protein [Caldilineaceae bacterium]
FSSCIAEAVKSVEQFHSDIQGINSDILEHYAEEFRQRFHSKDFLDSQAYLVWFQGKDIMKSLCSRLSPNFPRRNFEEWAAQHVDAKKHPDLHELISLIP